MFRRIAKSARRGRPEPSLGCARARLVIPEDTARRDRDAARDARAHRASRTPPRSVSSSATPPTCAPRHGASASARASCARPTPRPCGRSRTRSRRATPTPPITPSGSPPTAPRSPPSAGSRSATSRRSSTASCCTTSARSASPTRSSSSRARSSARRARARCSATRVIGEEIIREIDFLAPARAVVRHHHERWDGGGYPDGLAGEEIPLAARVFAVADAFDAITSDRPYRAARPLARRARALREQRGPVRPADPRGLRRDPRPRDRRDPPPGAA